MQAASGSGDHLNSSATSFLVELSGSVGILQSGRQDVLRMTRKLIFEGRKIRLLLAEEILPSGKAVRREVVEHPGAAVVLPLFDDGKVLLEDHYRFAVGGNLIEAVAGTLSPGEDPVECARRELTEETGLVAQNLIPLGSFYASPGVMTEVMHAYLATGLVRGERRLEEDEVLEPVEVALEEALDWAVSGKIRDGKTIATLFLAKAYLDGKGHGR
jgi:ADP-ribose pyrophosphatase